MLTLGQESEGGELIKALTASHGLNVPRLFFPHLSVRGEAASERRALY